MKRDEYKMTQQVDTTDYKQKYTEALDWMRSLYNGLHGKTKEDAEHYFPELRESEDEKIRKALIKYLDALDDDEIRYGVSFKDMRTWLEKQGEKTAERSEEDEANMDYSSEIIGFLKNYIKAHGCTAMNSWVNWLKSMKPNHWKPSEKQLEALWDIIPHIPNSEKDIDTITELFVLYEELKKL